MTTRKSPLRVRPNGGTPSELLHVRLVSKIPLPYSVTWPVVGIVYGGLAYVAVLFSGGTLQWIGGLVCGYIATMALAGVAIIWVWKALNRLLTPMLQFVDLPQEAIADWHSRQMKVIFNARGMTVTGLVVIILGMVSFIHQCQWFSWPVAWFGTNIANIVVAVVVSLLAWLLGTGLWILFQLARVTIDLGRLPLVLRSLQDPVCGVYVLGKLFLKISLILVLAYSVIAVTAIYLSPFKLLPGQSYFVLGWLVLGAIVVLVFFVVPQYSVHVAMVRVKQERLHRLASHLSSAFEEAISDSKPKRVTHIEKLVALDSYLRAMPEWPFDTKAFTGVLSAVVLPVGLAVLQMMLK